MSVTFYMDENVRGPIIRGLRHLGVNVLTAQEDGHATTADPIILDRATQLGRVLFRQDKDLLAEANSRQIRGIPFAGVVYGHQKLSIGLCVRDLEYCAAAGDPIDFADRVTYLPL